MGFYRCFSVSIVFMGIYGCLWIFEFLWVFMDFMGIYGCLSVSMAVYGYGLWISGCLWVFMGVMGVYGCL